MDPSSKYGNTNMVLALTVKSLLCDVLFDWSDRTDCIIGWVNLTVTLIEALQPKLECALWLLHALHNANSMLIENLFLRSLQRK